MANIVSCNNWKWSRDFQKRNKNKHDFSCLYAFKTKTQSPWESIWGSKAVHKPQILLQQLLFSSIAAQCLFFNSNLHLDRRKWKAWPSPPKLDNTIFRKTACTVCVCVWNFSTKTFAINALHWQQRFSWHYCTVRRGRSAKNLARSSIKKLLLHEVMTSQPIGGGVLAALTVP